MKKINAFCLSVALFSLSAMFNSALAIDHGSAPGVMCSAFDGKDQQFIRTARRTHLYVKRVVPFATIVKVNCPIIEHNRAARKYQVFVRLLHPSKRNTVCRLSTRNSTGTGSSGNTQSRSTGNTLGIRTLSFTVDPSRFDQHSMLRCEIKNGSNVETQGTRAATQIINYRWVED